MILEARDRIGGRTYTDTTTFPGIVWDVGGQWLHQVTPKLSGQGVGARTNNPLFDIAVRKRIPVFPDLNPRLLLNPPAKPVDLLESPVLDAFGGIALGLFEAALKASRPHGRDVSVGQATASLQGTPWYDLVSGLVITALGAPLDELSCLDILKMVEGGALGAPITPSVDNWLIPSGLGALVTSLAWGMPIHTSTTVDKIRWREKGGVSLETSAGTVQARAVIVTVPVGPLAAGRPDFSPGLPGKYVEAFTKQVKLGRTAKIALLYEPDFAFDVPQSNTFVSPYVDQLQEPLVQTQAFGHKNFAIVIIGGPQVTDIEAAGQLVDYGREQMKFMFGPSIDGAFQNGVASTWNTNQLTLGSYTHAVPGGVPGRRHLMTPLAGQIFFAGEAVSLGQHSSAHGAFLSGQRAAAKAVEALR